MDNFQTNVQEWVSLDNNIKKLNPNTLLFLGEKYFIHNKTFFVIF